MNVTTMTMKPAQAREKLAAVRAQLKRNATAEYRALEQAYRTVARGLRLLNISDAFTHCPLDERGRPRMALTRADVTQVVLREGYSNQRIYRFDRTVWGRHAPTIERSILHGRDPYPYPEGHALVPIIPPEHRGNHDLTKHYILWEVEAWANAPVRAVPDRDPYLLRHVGGDLYAIVAEWDLTDIERAVMAGRARR